MEAGEESADAVCAHLCWVWRNILMVVQSNLSHLVRDSNGVLMVCGLVDILENTPKIWLPELVCKEEANFIALARKMAEENLVDLSKHCCAHLFIWKMMASLHLSPASPPLYTTVPNLPEDTLLSMCMNRYASCLVQKCLRLCHEFSNVPIVYRIGPVLASHWEMLSNDEFGMFVLGDLLTASTASSTYLHNPSVQEWFFREAKVEGSLFQDKAGVHLSILLLRAIIAQDEVADDSAMHSMGCTLLDVAVDHSKYLSFHKSAHVYCTFLIQNWPALQVRLGLPECKREQLICRLLAGALSTSGVDHLDEQTSPDAVEMCTDPYFSRVFNTLVTDMFPFQQEHEGIEIKGLPSYRCSTYEDITAFFSHILDPSSFSTIVKHPHGISMVMAAYAHMGESHLVAMSKAVQQNFSELCTNTNSSVIVREFVSRYPCQFLDSVLYDVDNLAKSMVGLTVLSTFIEEAPYEVYKEFLVAILTQTHANIRRKEYGSMYIDLVDREAAFRHESNIDSAIVEYGKKWQTLLLDQIVMGSPKMAFCGVRAPLLCKLLATVGTDKHANMLLQELDREELATHEFGSLVMMELVGISSFLTIRNTIMRDFTTVLPISKLARREYSYVICIKLLEVLQSFEMEERLLYDDHDCRENETTSAKVAKQDFLRAIVSGRHKIATSSHGRHFLRVAMVHCDDLDTKLLISRELTLPLHHT
jgi:hypothetical protein